MWVPSSAHFCCLKHGVCTGGSLRGEQELVWDGALQEVKEMVARWWTPWLLGQQWGTGSPIPLLWAVHGAPVYGKTTAVTQVVQLHSDVSSDPKLWSFGGVSCGLEAGAVQDKLYFCLIMQEMWILSSVFPLLLLILYATLKLWNSRVTTKQEECFSLPFLCEVACFLLLYSMLPPVWR